MQKKYVPENIQFYNRQISPFLKEAISISKYNSGKNKLALLDLGSGDGAIIQSLLNQNIINNFDKILGIDFVEERCLTASQNIRNAYFVCGDTLKLPIQSDSIDLVNAWMVIEHVTDAQKMVKEIFRVLKDKGFLIISTVIKKRWAIYFYRTNHKFVLDPTHVKEYGSQEEFLTLLRKNSFDIEGIVTRMVRYSLLELITRLLIKLNLVKPQRARDIYVKNEYLSKITQFLQVPICGFYEIAVRCKKV